MLSDLVLRLRAIFRRTAVDREIDEELQLHLERQIAAYEAAGLKRDEATRRARIEFGGVDQIREEYCDALGVRFIDELWRDVRLAFRGLRATPLVTGAAILSLALGIGANTAMFSIIDSLLLRALRVKDPAALVLVTDSSSTHVRAWSYPVWAQIRQRSELFERSAAWSFTEFNLASGGETQLVDGMWASGSFFETLGVSALLGRTFSDVDDQPGAKGGGPVAVISYSFWRRRFGAAADVVGRSLTINDVPFSIVGVMPSDFSGPEVGRAFDVIVPVATEPLARGRDSFLDNSGITFLTIIARLKPNQSVEAATAGLPRVQSQIREATLGDIGRFGSRASIDRYLQAPLVLAPGAIGYSGAIDLRGMYERPLLTIMVVVVLLLQIACVNVANLLVARGIARQHELSVRLALGASRWQLGRQLFTESVVLYGIGAAIGVALAVWSSRILVEQLSTPTNTVFLDLSLDRRVLGFTVALTMIATLIFGTAPALRASRVEPMDALKQQARTITGHRRGTLAGSLIIVQVSLSLVLVVAAGLFVRTFSSLIRRPLGFEPRQVLIVNIDAHQTSNDPAQRIRLYERARDAVRRLPDVGEAALSLTTPIGAGQFTPSVEIDGVPDTRGPVWANLISPLWFATFQTPLTAGRDLTDRDRAGTPRVAVVNEAFARKFMGSDGPIGRTMKLYPHTALSLGPIEIVGVVGDAVYTSVRSPAPPTVYVPLAQFDHLTELGIRSINLSVRSKTQPPMAVAKGLTAALTAVNPQFALTFRPLVAQISASLTQERLIALLAGVFGALALLLAGIGLYGVTAYAVASQRTEIGIRMALGAPAPRVFSLVVTRTSLLVGAGVLLGTGASLWASRFVGTMVYGLEPRDPMTLVSAISLIVAVAALAASLPACRAVRIDPAAILRES